MKKRDYREATIIEEFESDRQYPYINNSEESNESITPSTFFSRVLLQIDGKMERYVEKYAHSNNTVLRFGITSSAVTEESVVGEKLAFIRDKPGSSGGSSKYTPDMVKDLIHHSL